MSSMRLCSVSLLKCLSSSKPEGHVYFSNFEFSTLIKILISATSFYPLPLHVPGTVLSCLEREAKWRDFFSKGFLFPPGQPRQRVSPLGSHTASWPHPCLTQRDGALLCVGLGVWLLSTASTVRMGIGLSHRIPRTQNGAYSSAQCMCAEGDKCWNTAAEGDACWVGSWRRPSRKKVISCLPVAFLWFCCHCSFSFPSNMYF